MKRFQASYPGPDGAMHIAPETFAAEMDADGWLAAEKRLIDLGVWTPPAQREAAAAAESERTSLTVADLCEKWLTDGHLKESVVGSQRSQLRRRVLNDPLGAELVVDVDRARIRQWWAEVQEQWPGTKPANSCTYNRLRAVFRYAVDELELIPSNPVNIRGASTPPRPEVRDRPLITLSEAQAMVDGISPSLRSPMELLLWCGLRIGELLELRRKDIRGLSGTGPVTLRIRRDAERVAEQVTDPETGKVTTRVRMQSFDTPKTDAGNRDIVAPTRVADRLREHCRDYVKPGAESLIVTTRTGKMMVDSNFRTRMKLGKRAAGREDVTPHDCRRFFGTMLVTSGVPLEEARRIFGHETVKQLMEYQRAASGYEKRAADVLDTLMPVAAAGVPTPPLPSATGPSVPGADGEGEDVPEAPER